jgi:hypothetical protein
VDPREQRSMHAEAECGVKPHLLKKAAPLSLAG